MVLQCYKLFPLALVQSLDLESAVVLLPGDAARDGL